jgi:hypothetical protein
LLNFCARSVVGTGTLGTAGVVENVRVFVTGAGNAAAGAAVGNETVFVATTVGVGAGVLICENTLAALVANDDAAEEDTAGADGVDTTVFGAEYEVLLIPDDPPM